jgi:hypothetical protein
MALGATMRITYINSSPKNYYETTKSTKHHMRARSKGRGPLGVSTVQVKVQRGKPEIHARNGTTSLMKNKSTALVM